MEEYYKNKISELKDENEDLKTKLIDLTFEVNYSKEKEMLEFLRDLKRSINLELKSKESNLSKEDILKNLNNYINDFAKDNRLYL